MLRHLLTALTLALLAACTSSDAPSTVSSIPVADTTEVDTESEFEAAVAEEDGVPILTSDADVLGEPTIVNAHFDEPSDAVWKLLARSEDPETPIINVEILPNSRFDESGANTELFTGRPAIVEESDSGMTRLTFAGDGRQWVQFSSFVVEDLELIGVASPFVVRGAELESPSTEWVVVGSIGLPLYENGHQTIFIDTERPSRVKIFSSRLTGEMELWYEWTIAERVDDPRFEWAFRQRSEDVGIDRFIALWDDDVVVEIFYIADDDVLADVIEGLREMRPGESEIVYGPTVDDGAS